MLDLEEMELVPVVGFRTHAPKPLRKEPAEAPEPDFPFIMDSTQPSIYSDIKSGGSVMLYYETSYRGNTMAGWVSEYIGCTPESKRPIAQIGFRPSGQGRSWYRLPAIGFDLSKGVRR